MWDGVEGARLQPCRAQSSGGTDLLAEKLDIGRVLKGHNFSCAEQVSPISERALARDRLSPVSEIEVPQWLKPLQRPDLCGTAKAVPFQNADGPCGAPEGAPLQNQRFALRMGFRYAKGLREETARAILRERNKCPLQSIADLAYRVPELRRNELVLLASIGALNSIGCSGEHPLSELSASEAHLVNYDGSEDEVPQGLKPGGIETGYGMAESRALSKHALSSRAHSKQIYEIASSKAAAKPRLHRRDALWQVERTARFAGPLLESIPESDIASPLAAMTPEERLVADFHGTGLTVGPHPMAYRRAQLQRAQILSAEELKHVANGRHVRTAGCVIARQRPGTAKGFVFLSLEDETGISNAIITPDILEQNRILITTEKFLLLEGILQKQEGVISVKVERVAPMREAYAVEAVDVTDANVRSHDFH